MLLDKKTKKPVEIGNAQILNEVSTAIHPLILLRYEAIAEFYTQEPIQVRIKLSKNNDINIFEQVFRIRIWIPNTRIASWCIYSQTRDLSDTDNHGVVLRNVVWERGYDAERVKGASKADKEILLNNWPSIKIQNIYLNRGSISSLLEEVFKMDLVLTKGITLDKRKEDEKRPEWADLEVMRLFDWGQVHSTWSQFMKSTRIENHILVVQEQFQKHIGLEVDDIYQIDFDYGYPTDDYKNLIYGNR